MRIVRLNEDLVHDVVADMPWEVTEALADSRGVLAGGVIRDAINGEEAKDIDIFCPSVEESEELAGSFGLPVRKTTFSRSVTIGKPIQFVFYRAFNSPAELIKQFDFLACAAAIYYTPSKGFVGIALEGFEEDAKAKRLTFLHQPKDEGSLIPLKRAMHFVAKGWRLPDEGLTGILNHFEPTLQVERVSRALRPSSYGGRR